MTIWYDVSGLVDWGKSHLGGIERTTAGILDGLHGLGLPLRLVHASPESAGFEPVAEERLPESVRVMCPWLKVPARHYESAIKPPPTAAENAAERAAAERLARRQRRRELIYGAGVHGEALRNSWIAFRTAGRELVGHAGRRFGLSARRGRTTLSTPGPADQPAPAASPPSSVPFTRGDVLLSLGGTFAMQGHREAVDAARSRGVSIVRMVYDMVPITKPHWLTPQTTQVAWLRHVVERSDVVLTISACTRRELTDYCREAGLAMPRIGLVRLGDVSTGRAADELPPLPRFVPRRPFFLCVSTLDVRKNHRCLYEAWTALVSERGEQCPDLLCVGMSHAGVSDLIHEIRHDPVVNRHLHLLNGVCDAELTWYYRNCVATIYPSKHEGWGIPVAESLAHGRLCLASSAASLREISDLPEFFAPHDTPRLVALVERSLDDPAWRTAREARIRAEFRPTTWTDTATEIITAVGITGDSNGMPGVAA